jgi:hypothetical protein
MYKIMIIFLNFTHKTGFGRESPFMDLENKNARKDCLFDKKYIFAPVTKTFYNVRHRYKS